MAILYPRFMPWDEAFFAGLPSALRVARARSILFEHEPQEAFAPEQGGRFVSVQLGPSLWRMQLQTTPTSELEFSLWRAWLDTLEGAKREFLGYDVRRPMPWNYRHPDLLYPGLPMAGSSSQFFGISHIASISADRTVITTASTSRPLRLPVGFQLEIGDYVAVVWPNNPLSEDLSSMHRIVERPLAAASNGQTAISVRPPVPSAAAPDLSSNQTEVKFGGTDVNLTAPVRAACLMRITRRERSAEHKSRSISFEAVQSLRFK